MKDRHQCITRFSPRSTRLAVKPCTREVTCGRVGVGDRLGVELGVAVCVGVGVGVGVGVA